MLSGTPFHDHIVFDGDAMLGYEVMIKAGVKINARKYAADKSDSAARKECGRVEVLYQRYQPLSVQTLISGGASNYCDMT